MTRMRTAWVVATLVAASVTACSSVAGTSSTPKASHASATKRAVAAPVVSTPSAAPSHPSSPAVASACTHNRSGKLVLVDVSEQHLWLCQGTRSTFDSPVTSGAVDLPYDSTPTGTFRVQAKDRHRTLTLLGGQQFTVKYWIPFQGPLFGFHDSPWQKMAYGSQRYRTKGSHGCVHLPLATISHLYHWADVGTPVRIRH